MTTESNQPQGEPSHVLELKKPPTVVVVAATLVFVLLLAGLFVIGWLPHRNRIAEADADARDRQNDLPTVSVTRPRPTRSSQDIVLPGDLRPNQETSIFARATGYVKSLKVDIGDHVESGQLLAEIDTPEVDAQLAQARGSLEEAQAMVKKAQTDLELTAATRKRYEESRQNDTGSIPEQQLDERRSAEKQAASALAAAQASVVASTADVQRLLTLQSFEKVTAPFSGVITTRGYDLGALVASSIGSRELFQLVQTDPMLVFINVPQTFSTNIKIGNEARLTIRNWPGREFEGVVARTSGALDPATRTLTVEVHFPNKEGQLLAGMYGQVTLKVSNEQPVLTVPTSAVVFDTQGLTVAVVKDDRVEFRKVSVGRDLGTEMEIVTGLSEEDDVVANPGERISNGSLVKAVPMKEPSAPSDKPSVAGRERS